MLLELELFSPACQEVSTLIVQTTTGNFFVGLLCVVQYLMYFGEGFMPYTAKNDK